jgi:Raf kinase inhibitor-like YbhB/YbcL family protein
VVLKHALLAAVLVAMVAVLVSGCTSEPAESGTNAEDGAEAPATEEETTDEEFTLTSSAFEDGGEIPVKYCNVGVEGGENVSIPLDWDGVPADAKSLALVMVDRHEVANEWVHWAVVDIPVSTTSIGEGESGSLTGGAWELNSTNGEPGYQGPQPPPGSGDHEYETILFALDVENSEVAEDVTFAEFLDAMDAHHIAEVSVSGFFGR